jgi:hypothetical protein
MSAVTHGVYSRKVLAPEAHAIAESLMATPSAIELDRLGAEEVGALLALIQRIDAALLEQRLVNARGKPHPLLELRIRLSGRCERWLLEFFATPLARTQWPGHAPPEEPFAEVVRRELTVGLSVMQAARERGDLHLPDPEDGA